MALRYWEDDKFSEAIQRKSKILGEELGRFVGEFPELGLKVRGRGLIFGLEFPNKMAKKVSREAFNNGLIIEVAGAEDNVLKFLPPLIIDEELIHSGLNIIKTSLESVLDHREQLVVGGVR